MPEVLAIPGVETTYASYVIGAAVNVLPGI